MCSSNLNRLFKVYSTPFGIGVAYECVYNRNITVSAAAFEVSSVTAFGANRGFGNLANSFSLNLDGFSANNRFLMGSQMSVEISWALTRLSKLNFVIDKCSVGHGDVKIDVIKGWGPKIIIKIFSNFPKFQHY